jgi:hypothetical protein
VIGVSFGFQNLVLLFGLAAVAIPVVIHLLNRRRYDVIDWGAMQFLQMSRTTRRRLRLEELLLLLLRMGLIAVLVLALAGPYAGGELLAAFADRPPRDLVVIVDGSASMGREASTGATPFANAKEWVERLLDGLTTDDRMALIFARAQPEFLIPALTPDHAEVGNRLAYLSPPGGSSDLPRALEEAQRILRSQGRPARQEIVLITDGQRWGWADPDTLPRWQQAARLVSADAVAPRILAVHVPWRDQTRNNFSLAPIKTSRATVWSGQQVTFRTALRLEGFAEFQSPWRIRALVDGQPVQDLPLPAPGDLKKGEIGLEFRHRFATPGSQVVSILVDADLPSERRPPDYRLKDCLPADNRQDFALTVQDTMHVLLVDGTQETGPESTTFFVKKALEQSPDPKRPPVVQARVVSHIDFRPELLAASPAQRRPRVVVLADVPRLSAVQNEAFGRFIEGGGGVLIALGPRVEADGYKDNPLLPGRIEKTAQDAKGASPDVRRMQHPALRVFAEEAGATLSQARLPRWYSVTPAGQATVGARLENGDPLLLERTVGEGHVLLWTAPLDRSWGSNLPGILEYPVLIHELISYLADAGRIEQNVGPGHPLRYRPRADEPVPLPARLVLQPPLGEAQLFHARRWPWIDEAARPPGVYGLSIDKGVTIHYVVQPDPREYDLTPCTDEDRQAVARIIPVEYGDKLADLAEESAPQDLWWLFLVAVSLLLCIEVWMTRRMTAAQEGEA